MEATRQNVGEYLPFLSCGWYLSWMQLLGLLPYGVSSSNPAAVAETFCTIPDLRTIVTTLWSGLVLLFIALYAAVNFRNTFLAYYRKKLEDLEFFTLAIHSFRLCSCLLPAIFIIVSFFRKRNCIPGFIQKVSLELFKSSTDLKGHSRIIRALCCCIPVWVGLVCIGMTFTALRVVRYAYSKGIFPLFLLLFTLLSRRAVKESDVDMQMPIQINWFGSGVYVVSSVVPLWLYLMSRLSGPIVYMSIQTTVDFFLVICACAIGFGFDKVNRDLEKLKADYDLEKNWKGLHPKVDSRKSVSTLNHLQALNLRHLTLHECVGWFNELFAVEVLLLTCRNVMAFLAVVAVLLNVPGRKESTKSPVHVMDKSIVYSIWSMGIVAIMGAVTHISAFVWMSDKVINPFKIQVSVWLMKL